ncbi:MAG TPA: nucleoside deaminase [Actinospica sp.]|nr:nucleoside deaminase [Actinospica sp.]
MTGRISQDAQKDWRDGARSSEADRAHLRRAVELSGAAEPGGGDLPFGAVVALDGRIVAEARNQVGSRSDPTAHAEMLALRAAGARLNRPTLDGAVLYSSGEPCPMCLAACYWARIERVVHAATVDDAAESGFEDAEYYRQLALPKQRRTLRIDAGEERLRAEAIAVQRRFADAS